MEGANRVGGANRKLFAGRSRGNSIGGSGVSKVTKLDDASGMVGAKIFGSLYIT